MIADSHMNDSEEFIFFVNSIYMNEQGIFNSVQKSLARDVLVHRFFALCG